MKKASAASLGSRDKASPAAVEGDLPPFLTRLYDPCQAGEVRCNVSQWKGRREEGDEEREERGE